ncbi:Hypothetical protein HDN1F_29360 [gamma proteobacterium HdN1]|nr:Hypothetical protein HDN1F_29360 [gamma proteobacterium HdN1]
MTDDTQDVVRDEALRPKKKLVYKPAEATVARKTAAVARGPQRRGKPIQPPKRPVEVPVDADLAWIQESLKGALYVGDVLTRRDQYFNKVLSLKRKFAAGKEREYAASIEVLCERLKSHPMQASLRDVLRDDPQLRKFRFFR